MAVFLTLAPHNPKNTCVFQDTIGLAMKLKIRPMQQTDIDRVYSIELLSHRTPWSRDILSDCVLVGYDCRVLEFTIDGTLQIVGYIICRYSFNVCHILNISVDPAKQRQGFGKLLLKTLLDSLNKANIDTVILEVRPSNVAAIALYEKFGFLRDSIKKSYYKDNTGEEDAILLKKIRKS
jgi:[ribosomal protein S18]-alanine N-acetyltransferase